MANYVKWIHACHVSRKNHVLTTDSCSQCGRERTPAAEAKYAKMRAEGRIKA